MNSEKSNYNTQSYLEGESFLENQQKQTEKFKQLKKYRIMSIALVQAMIRQALGQVLCFTV